MKIKLDARLGLFLLALLGTVFGLEWIAYGLHAAAATMLDILGLCAFLMFLCFIL